MNQVISNHAELDALTDGAVLVSLIHGQPTGRVWGKVEGTWWGLALECPDSPALPATVLREGQ